WQPVVYCWRGGQRSRSLVHVLCEIGWRAAQLDGGYRAYRRHVVSSLAARPQQFRFRLVYGLTGCGKSRLLTALAAEGAQVLDLERIACHRGSLLGDVPGAPTPLLNAIESLANRLARLVPLHGKKAVERWIEMATSGDHDALIAELLTLHYDPTYTRSIERNFPRHCDAAIVDVVDISPAGFRALA